MVTFNKAIHYINSCSLFNILQHFNYCDDHQVKYLMCDLKPNILYIGHCNGVLAADSRRNLHIADMDLYRMIRAKEKHERNIFEAEILRVLDQSQNGQNGTEMAFLMFNNILYNDQVIKNVFWFQFKTEPMNCIYLQHELFNQAIIFNFWIFLKYEVEEIFGHGGCGVVFLVENELFENFALKAETSGEEETLVLDAAVLKKLQQIKSVHIPRLIASGSAFDGKINFIIIPLLGESLEDLKKSGLDFYSIIRLFQQGLLALMDLHCAGILHCDLKPDNLLIGPESSPARQILHVVDFGLAERMPKEQKPVETFFGTACFASIAAHELKTQSLA